MWLGWSWLHLVEYSIPIFGIEFGENCDSTLSGGEMVPCNIPAEALVKVFWI